MKESLHHFLKEVLTKEPNTNKSTADKMCINCHTDAKALFYLDKTYDFDNYLSIMKEIKQNLIKRDYNIALLSCHKNYYYSN